MKKDISYFLKKPETKITEIEAPERFKGEDGQPLMMQVKILTQEEIDKIFDMYTTKRTERDRKKNPLVVNGEVAMRKDRDSAKAVRHLIAEALVYPNLHDKQVQDFYGCYELPDLVYKMFPTPEEFQYVTNAVLEVLGLTDDTEDENDIDAAKN